MTANKPIAVLPLRRAPAKATERAEGPRLVPRPRLVRRLLGAAPARVVLLTAPVGYGKTTVLREWEQCDPRPFAWLDGDGAAPAASAAARRFATPSVVVIDADRGVTPMLRESVLRLADAVPRDSLLVVSARAGAGLPLVRLRLEHEVLELGARDLAMTHDEAVAVLRAAGVTLDAPAADALIARLDGWPVAVAVSALARTGADADAAHLDADDLLGEYLAEEILHRLDPEARELLRRCSILDTLEPDLCSAVAGVERAGALLHDLERSGLPVFRLNRDGRRLRCHPLLRGVLRAELRRTEPVTARRLHRVAGAWFADRGDVETALTHALAARDVDGAAGLLWQMAPSYAWGGRVARLESWLAELPARDIERRPALAGVAALVDVVRGRLGHAERWIVQAQRARGPGGQPPAPAVAGGLALLRAITVRHDLDAVRAHAAAAAAQLPPGDPWAPLCCWLQGVGATVAGEAAAGDRLEDGVRAGIVDSTGLAALCEAELALTALCAAEWEHGVALAERARGRVEQAAPVDCPMLVLVAAVAALARAHRGRFAEARADVAWVQRGLAHPDGLPPWLLAHVEVALARAELRLSTIAEGRVTLASASRRVMRLTGAPALEAWVHDARRYADAAAIAGVLSADRLTTAELRVLRHLPSHLSFREIGTELYISPNTVKTQAHAVYRKLGATSRSAAVERARALGLLDGTSTPWGHVAAARAS